jgi:hypothetical protein
LMEILKSELFRIVAQRTSVSLAGKEMLDWKAHICVSFCCISRLIRILNLKVCVI